ncbi:MAG: sn-glycerol-3-phosphate ABC transporter ATP-binding protein UgpC [Pseudomonadota bacterium]
MSGIRLSGVKKRFGRVETIHGIDLAIAEGEFVVFVGPSGCGKSTLLRLIAGLDEVSAGTLEIGGQIVNDIAPAARGVAMVFQSYALYPHMTVFENMAFGLKLRKVEKGAVEAKVREAARILELEPLLDRKPAQLSGGQRQRVAIGRAITRDPSVFLFDEPLSNLDAGLRGQMRTEIARLHDRLGATMVYVTHDQTEAMTLADRIVVLRDGRVEQVGTPLELYHHPANRFVAGFIGSPPMNFLPAKAFGEIAEGAAEIGVRPEDLAPAADGMFPGAVTLIEELGEAHLLHVETSAGTMIAKLNGAARHERGQEVTFAAPADRLHRFDADGRRLDPAVQASTPADA